MSRMDSLFRRKEVRVWAEVALAGTEVAGTGLWLRLGLMVRGVARRGGGKGGAGKGTEDPETGG